VHEPIKTWLATIVACNHRGLQPRGEPFLVRAATAATIVACKHRGLQPYSTCKRWYSAIKLGVHLLHSKHPCTHTAPTSCASSNIKKRGGLGVCASVQLGGRGALKCTISVCLSLSPSPPLLVFVLCLSNPEASRPESH
jgi:hypothetical protein